MRRFRQGFFRAGRIGGAHVRLHWTLPLGAVVLGRFELVPTFWAGFVALIFIHELGHAFFIRRARQRVVSLDVHGLGGVCRWDGYVTERQRTVIAWGGVIAQASVLLIAGAVRLAAGPPTAPWAAQLSYAFIEANLYLMAFNLLPIPPLDGVEAWSFVRRLRGRRSRRRQPPAGGRPRVPVLDEAQAQDAMASVDEQIQQIADKVGRDLDRERTSDSEEP